MCLASTPKIYRISLMTDHHKTNTNHLYVCCLTWHDVIPCTYVGSYIILIQHMRVQIFYFASPIAAIPHLIRILLFCIIYNFLWTGICFSRLYFFELAIYVHLSIADNMHYCRPFSLLSLILMWC